MFRKLRLFNMFSSLFRANFQNATHLIGVALSAFHRIPNPLQCLGQGCARAGDVDPLEAATAVSEDLAAVEPQLRLVDDLSLIHISEPTSGATSRMPSSA